GPNIVDSQLENCEHKHSNAADSKNMTISIKECTNSNQKFGCMPKRK
ncbi:20646_t:CDS:1, partial [Gigaspora margarita]